MPSKVKTLLRRAYLSRPLNRWAVRAHAWLRPPPFRRDNIEFERDVWNGICTFYAANGRQVGENNTNPELYRELIPTLHKVCHFEGSRFGRQVNITALRHMITVWDDVLQFTTMLRNRHLEHRRLEGRRFNLRQGYVFSKLGAGYLSYLARRSDQPLQRGTLPAMETAAFTVGVGPFMVVRALMERGDLAALQTEPLSAAALYELADSSGSLLAGADRACAGSRQMIQQYLDVAMNGSYDGPLESQAAQRAMARIDDWPRFFRYIDASSRVELLIKLNRALCARDLLALLEAPQALRDSERAAVREHFCNCYYRAAGTVDDRTALDHFIVIVLALLEELHGGAVQRELAAARLLEPLAADPAPTRRSEVARRLRLICALDYAHCRDQLTAMNLALGRSDAPQITLQDFYLRTAGAGFEVLLTALAHAETPGLDTLSIRPLSLEQDLADLHSWFNLDYARFWGAQGKPLEAVRNSYQAQLDRPGSEVLIGIEASTGRKAFLLETYAPLQDDLRHYYPALASDRGCHFFMAPATTPVHDFSYHAFGAMMDHVFRDAAIQRVVAEPDIRNRKVVTRLMQRGFERGPVLHLQYKTAQLMYLSRARHTARRLAAAPRLPDPPLYELRAGLQVFAGRLVRKLRRLRGRH